MKLFPHALIRIGGGPYDHLESIQIQKTPALLEDIIALSHQAQQLRLAISDSLFARLPEIEDPTLQKKLLNLKRDVFNGRNLSPTKVALLQENLPKPGQISQYVQTLDQIQQLETSGEQCYKQELELVRARLQSLTKDENLRRGLVLSSQSLLRSCDWYAGKNPKKLKKQDLKTELSLVKYLTRIYGKTSPFSTFTHLAMGSLNEGGGDGQLFAGTPAPQEPVGHIRVNNFIFKSLQGLLPQHPAYRNWIRVRPNPTLVREDQNYLYLTNSNNVESFQRIPLNPVLDLFWELCAQKPEGLRFMEIIAEAGEAVEASEEDLTAYVCQLLEYGFLEYNFEVSGIDPDWDMGFLAVARQWDTATVPHLNELLEVLQHLREKSKIYADLDSAGRISMLEEVFKRFRQVYIAIHIEAGLPEEERLSEEENRARKQARKDETSPEGGHEDEDEDEDELAEGEEQVFKHSSSTWFTFKPEQMFYEDAAFPEALELNRDAMAALLDEMNQLYTQLDLFNVSNDELLLIQDYFQKKYSQPVDLLTFYEAFYRDYKKPQAENKHKQELAQARRKSEPEKLAEIEAELALLKEEEQRFQLAAHEELRNQRNAWDAAFKTRINFDPSQTRLQLADVVANNQDQNRTSKEARTSYALFLQPFCETREDGSTRLMAVINSNPNGFGKLFSRFLHIFDPKFTKTVRQFNRDLDPDAYLLEDTDASFFNANLHPPLMPHEIWMPGGQNSLPPENHVPITEIKIGIDQETARVALTHKEKALYVFDLGFQSIKGRSELFQLLARFSKAQYITWSGLVGAVNQSARKEEKEGASVTWQPRIVLEDRLVLQRRTWVFSKAALPVALPEDNPWSWYRRVYEWKTAHGLPNDVFVIMNNLRSNDKLEPEERKKVGRDDYKPQLISFNSPVLVRLFEKLVDKTPRTMTLSEMLPAPSQLQKFGDSRFITELVVQWEAGIDE